MLWNIVFGITRGHVEDLEHLLLNTCCCAVVFLPQWASIRILCKSYGKTEAVVERRILLALVVLHCGLMLGDMTLLLTLTYDLECFISSIVLFLCTGIHLMFLRKVWQGIVVTLFSLIAWIQPFIFWSAHQ